MKMFPYQISQTQLQLWYAVYNKQLMLTVSRNVQ